MIDRIALLVVDAAGVPKTNATPKFTVYRAGGADRAPPTGALSTPLPHLGGGMYGCTASADDVAAGTAFVIDAAAGQAPNTTFAASGGTRGFGSVNPANAPLFAQLFEDGAGALWAGAPPTLGIWNDFTGAAPTPAPTVFPIVAPYFFGFRPSTDDLLAGRVFRWNAPAGAYPQYPHGVAFYGSGTPGTSLGEAIVAELAADPDVVALVGTRMYPNVLPQGVEFPALVYSIISTVPENTLAGDASERLNTIRLQVDCWSKTYVEAHALDQAVDQVISNLGTPDLSAWRSNSRDLYDNDVQRHRVSTDYTVMRGRG